MPTYQYRCTEPDCDNRFELVQAFTDPAVTECPVCNGTVRKVYGSVGVVFKGSGFYRNDSRSGSNGSDAKSESRSESKSESKSETKSDSKSESKSEAKSGSKSESKPAAKSDSSSSSKAAASA